MAYRFASERVVLEVDAGLTVEVERIASWAVQQRAVRLAAIFSGAPESSALRDLYEFFVLEAQPTWDLIDHRGPIPPTTGGMLRLPLAFGLALVKVWAESLAPDPEPESTAVDAVIPPGPARDALNAELRKARRKSP